MTAPTPCLSFIGIVDFSQEAKWLFMTESVTELLGYEPKDLIGTPSLELVHPDEFPRVKQLHYDTIQQDKAAVLVYLRMKHKDPFRGYVLCGVSRTVVHNVLVGSVSFASPGAKALHNASTAQEITVITPSAANFEFRRWHDPSPMPPSPIPEAMNLPASPSPSTASWDSRSPRSSRSSARRLSDSSDHSAASSQVSVSPERRGTSSITSGIRSTASTASTAPRREPAITFNHLSNKSFRTAFILDRFSSASPIMYCSNDLLVSTTAAIGRTFYDFVSARDEEIVRSWITCVKGWGVNEKGQPSDGGFGFGKFMLLTEGRDSVSRMPEPVRARNRHGSTSSRTAGGPRSGRHSTAHSSSGGSQAAHPHSRSTPAGTPSRNRGPTHSPAHASREAEQIEVDAIFSAHSDGLMVILRRSS